MNMSGLSGLEGLAEIGMRGGADMRPTLLRVLTDLYVQKLAHTPDEERHYTELALRLLDSVDVATRATIAARLAHHLAPPSSVIARLGADLPEVVAALRRASPPRPRGTLSVPERAASRAAINTAGETTLQPRAPAPNLMGSDVAGELNELFFAADASERRMILRNLHIVAGVPPLHSGLARDPTLGRKLEVAVLARRREEIARELARCLRISHRQAERIANDELGEPIVVAAKVLNIPRDLLYRILLFVNAAVGHSVERVHTLATLYDEIAVQAAEDLVSVWQALPIEKDQRVTAPHRTLFSSQPSAARSAATSRRLPAALHDQLRRDAS